MSSVILMYDTCSCVGNYFCTKEKKHYFLTQPHIYIYIYIYIYVCICYIYIYIYIYTYSPHPP